MGPIIYTIDPDPDTIIILKKACTSFAQWEPVAVERVVLEPEQPMPSLQVDEEPPPAIDEEPPPSPPHPHPDHELPEEVEETAVWGSFAGPRKPTKKDLRKKMKEEVTTSARASLFGNETNATAGPSRISEPRDTADEDMLPPAISEGLAEPEEEGIHYHVSSRHLMLASPWFKRVLAKDKWGESNPDEIDGLMYIQAESWDPEALLIILQIFHLRNKQVPRKLNLEMLAKIAILVDYYECGEAIELFTDMWIDNLKKTTMPSTYSRDLLLWIWVSWVFDLTDQFKQATAVAIKRSTEQIRTLELPIPGRVSVEINSKRYLRIESVIDGFHSLLDKYRSVSYVCPNNHDLSFLCGSFLLGALTKALDSCALLMPRPEVPFSNLSFDGVCEKIRNIESPEWAEPSSRHYRSYPHPCTLYEAVISVVSVADAAVVGLDVWTMKEGKGVCSG